GREDLAQELVAGVDVGAGIGWAKAAGRRVVHGQKGNADGIAAPRDNIHRAGMVRVELHHQVQRRLERPDEGKLEVERIVELVPVGVGRSVDLAARVEGTDPTEEGAIAVAGELTGYRADRCGRVADAEVGAYHGALAADERDAVPRVLQSLRHLDL